MSHCQACTLEFKSATLASDFGLALFKKKFPDSAEKMLAEIGVYTKGKQQGKYRGQLCWVKCVQGGFDYVYRSGVIKRGSFAYAVNKDAYAQQNGFDFVDAHPFHNCRLG